jgi:hypothetical protein
MRDIAHGMIPGDTVVRIAGNEHGGLGLHRVEITLPKVLFA